MTDKLHYVTLSGMSLPRAAVMSADRVPTMTRTPLVRLAVLATALALAGCGGSSPAEPAPAITSAVASPTPTPSTPVASATPAPSSPVVSPTAVVTPSVTPPAPTTPPPAAVAAVDEVTAAPVPEEPAATEEAWWFQYSSCSKLKKNKVGHPTGPFRADDPDEAEIYDWFANGTGHRGDGDDDGLACE